VGDEDFTAIARTADIPPRKTLCVELSGREILICHIAEGFFAVDNICSHAAEKLNNGRLKGHRILCPLHGAAFDVRDGSALSRPATVPLRTYPLRVEGENILIAVTAAE
jgi:3-phenylpropionate/trans-cinnamate dioxygenase ferredoxin subunit